MLAFRFEYYCELQEARIRKRNEPLTLYFARPTAAEEMRGERGKARVLSIDIEAATCKLHETSQLRTSSS